MEIKVTINAPGLEGAIHTLAQVLANYELPVNIPGSEVVEQPKQEVQAPQPVQQAPVQQPVPTQQPPQQAPVQQPPVQQEVPQQAAVPTSNPTYSMDQLAVAATQLMDAGRRDDVVNLITSFGVQALTALPQEQYGAFATRLRELGAKI
ncbi:hypothetical protein [Paucisalibacillus globulus]|uniref:hypothetical protein n=1 Tax=Paucisalibacillus globulus TaxID=351095 RepID=UPI001143EF26|nr:hypothetical protein [Paucisalibacillus globulus]